MHDVATTIRLYVLCLKFPCISRFLVINPSTVVSNKNIYVLHYYMLGVGVNTPNPTHKFRTDQRPKYLLESKIMDFIQEVKSHLKLKEQIFCFTLLALTYTSRKR